MNIETDPASDVEYFPSSRPWLETEAGVCLVGTRCSACQTIAFPEKTFCNVCGGEQSLQRAVFSPFGTLYSYSEVHAAPKGFTVPYVIGYVDLEDGVRVCGQIEHPGSELRLDAAVRVVLGVVRRNANGQAVISYKFRKRSA